MLCAPVRGRLLSLAQRRYCFVKLVVFERPEVAAVDASGLRDEDGGGLIVEAVGTKDLFVGVQAARVRDFELLYVLAALLLGAVPRDAEEQDLAFVRSGDLPEAGLFGPALSSPGGPEVQDDGELPEGIGQRERVAVERPEREVVRLLGLIACSRRGRHRACGPTPASNSQHREQPGDPDKVSHAGFILYAVDLTQAQIDTAVRMAVAAAMGMAIGVERELREQAAGLRTHMLVAVGACLFTIVSAYGFEGFATTVDPSRVAAQIVTGIGFLGAGAILREGLSVRGLTTAASLWITAAIGMAVGLGMYWASGVAVAITLVSLLALRPFRSRLRGRAEQSGPR